MKIVHTVKKAIAGTVMPKERIQKVSSSLPEPVLKASKGRMPIKTTTDWITWESPQSPTPEQITPVGGWEYLYSLTSQKPGRTPGDSDCDSVTWIRLFSDIFKDVKGCGYFRKEDDNFVQICNFTILVKKRNMVIHPYENTVEEIQMQIVYGMEDELHASELLVKAEEYHALAEIITRKFPACWINQKEKKEFPKIAATEFGRCNIKDTRFAWMQWGPVDEGGNRSFYEGDHREFKHFPDTEASPEILQVALQMFTVAEKKVSYSLSVFQACSFLAQLFIDAGFPLQHTLALIAPSGTGKSSLSKAMTQPFTNTEKKLIPILSTKAALKGLTPSYVDDIMCVDDLAPEGSQKSQETRVEALQELIRSYCDEGGAAYKYSGARIGHSQLRGGLLWTAEDMPAMITSGEARTLRVEFSTHPDYDQLTQFQDDPEILAVFWFQFILFLEADYSTLVSEVTTLANRKRREVPKFQHPRMTDILVHMDIAATILCRFLSRKGLVSEVESASLQRDMEVVFEKLVKLQDENTKKHDPIYTFIEAVFSLRSVGKLTVAETPKAYGESNGLLHGYMDGPNLMMLLPNEVYALVESYCQKARQAYPLTAEATWKKLREYGLIYTTEKTGNLRRASVKADPHRIRFLCLKIKESETYLERERK